MMKFIIGFFFVFQTTTFHFAQAKALQSISSPSNSAMQNLHLELAIYSMNKLQTPNQVLDYVTSLHPKLKNKIEKLRQLFKKNNFPLEQKLPTLTLKGRNVKPSHNSNQFIFKSISPIEISHNGQTHLFKSSNVEEFLDSVIGVSMEKNSTQLDLRFLIFNTLFPEAQANTNFGKIMNKAGYPIGSSGVHDNFSWGMMILMGLATLGVATLAAAAGSIGLGIVAVAMAILAAIYYIVDGDPKQLEQVACNKDSFSFPLPTTYLSLEKREKAELGKTAILVYDHNKETITIKSVNEKVVKVVNFKNPSPIIPSALHNESFVNLLKHCQSQVDVKKALSDLQKKFPNLNTTPNGDSLKPLSGST